LISKLARILTDRQVDKGKLPSDEREVFYYAFENLISDIFNILLSLGIGFLFGKCFEMLVFLACYGMIRKHAGGYHACTRGRCNVISICIVLLIVSLNCLEYSIIPVWIMCIVVIMLSFGIIHISPVEAINKPLNFEEKKKNKISTLKNIVLINLFAYLWMILFLDRSLLYNAMLAFTAVLLLQIFGMIKLYHYKNNQGR